MDGGSTADRTISAVASILTLAALLVPLEADAYSPRPCHGGNLKWNQKWTNMYISTASFPSGSLWDKRLQNAMWYWNQVQGSSFTFYVGRDEDDSYDSGNRVNEIVADDLGDNDTLAVTHMQYICERWFDDSSSKWRTRQSILETDLVFNLSKTWNTGALNYSRLDSPYSFEGVALHELGHVLGLAHEDRWMATMNSRYPSGGPLGHSREWDPLADDRAGVRFLYPDNTTERDVAASAFKRTGAGSSGLVNSPSSAVPGSEVSIEFTFSNLGTRAETFDIGFYLSPDGNIDPFDIRLGGNFSVRADPGFTGTFSRRLRIPSSVAPETYRLGFIVDDGDAISEDHEGNNDVALPRPITVGSGTASLVRAPSSPEAHPLRQ